MHRLESLRPNFRVSIWLARCLVTLAFLLDSAAFCVDAQPILPQIKELWVGEMTQESPVPWKGRMELFLRYSSGEEDPRDFEGVVTWPSLGEAQTKVIGKKSWSEISFVEKQCLSGECNRVTLGGKYSGKFNQTYDVLEGSASILGTGFSGKFLLRRVVAPER